MATCQGPHRAGIVTTARKEREEEEQRGRSTLETPARAEGGRTRTTSEETRGLSTSNNNSVSVEPSTKMVVIHLIQDIRGSLKSPKFCNVKISQ